MSVRIEGVETPKQLRMIEALGTIAGAQRYLSAGLSRKGRGPKSAARVSRFQAA
jgi:hypothetical protein